MRRGDDLFPARRSSDTGHSPFGTSAGSSMGPSSGDPGSPWQMMRRMQEDMDRIFGQLIGGEIGAGGGMSRASAGQQGRGTWAPSVDISQTDREWCIEAELPGVKKDDIEVNVQDGYLILTAETRSGEDRQNGEGTNGGAPEGQRRYHTRERRYGFFQRIIALPPDVNEDDIRCEFRDGVLTLHLPRQQQEQARGRRIPVMAAEGDQVSGRPSGQGAMTAGGGTAQGQAAGTQGTAAGRSPERMAGGTEAVGNRTQTAESREMTGAKGGEAASGKAGEEKSGRTRK